MPKKNICLLIAAIIISLTTRTVFAVQSPEESLRKDFPRITYDGIKPSPIPGIFEVITRTGIFYYAPETQMIIDGDIYTKDNRNLTQERRLEIIRSKQKDIPLDKALKIGNGAHTVIEFTNPDCSYCRAASHFLAGRTDITRYIFFLTSSPRSEQKVRYVLCAADPAKAYEEAMTGKLDDGKFTVCDQKNVLDQLKAHRAVAQNMGINATPFFFIDGHVVQGADMPVLEKLLGKKKKK